MQNAGRQCELSALRDVLLVDGYEFFVIGDDHV